MIYTAHSATITVPPQWSTGSGCRCSVLKPVVSRHVSQFTGSSFRWQQNCAFQSRRPSPSSLISYSRFVKTTIRAAANTGGQIYVPAAEGQLAARIIKALLQAGFKVTAGVSDLEEAEAAVQLAKKLELVPSALGNLKLVEVDPTDEVAVAEAMPKKGARVLVVAGDNYGGRKSDARAIERVLSAVLGEDAPAANQIVLVSPLRSAGGTGFFGLGGSPKAAVTKLSKLEQAVVDSGVNYIILRTGATDGVDSSYAEVSNVFMQPFGSIPAQSIISKEQVAAAVPVVLSAAVGDHVIELAADGEAPALDLQDVVSQVLEESLIEGEEEEEMELEVEEVIVPAPSRPALPFGFGGRAAAKQVVQEEEEEEEVAPPRPAPKLPAWMRASATPAAKEKEPEEEEEDKVAGKPLFSFGRPATPRASISDEASAAQTSKSSARIAVKEREEPAGNGGRTTPGFLSMLGMGQKSVYVDEIEK